MTMNTGARDMIRMVADRVTCPMSGGSFYRLTTTIHNEAFMLVLDTKASKDQVEAGFRKLATQIAMGDTND